MPVYLTPSSRIQYKLAAYAGATKSAVVNLAGFALRGFVVPTGFVGTTLTFFASASDVSVNTDAKLVQVFDEAGIAVSVIVAPNRYVTCGKEVSEKLNAVGNNLVVQSNASETVTLTLVTVASGK
jgi:hypothetical protein